MKFKLLFFLTLISSSVFHRTIKLFTNSNGKPKKKDKDYKSELTTLIKNENESYFESLSKFKYDSLKTSLIEAKESYNKTEREKMDLFINPIELKACE
ncbi:hypothetical protein [Kaistella sp.]|uniref:hypothetical protein n=1 Tax=Kaistella sp. TaxID=2782235 RepID=UPI003C639E37